MFAKESMRGEILGLKEECTCRLCDEGQERGWDGGQFMFAMYIYLVRPAYFDLI